MLSRLSCSHSARHRYLFGASNISCVQCAISAFKAINEVETKSSIELTDAELYAAVQCLDSLPKLLELVLPFAAEPAILASLTRQMIGLCLSPLMFVCRGESIDRKLNKSLKISLEYLRKLPLEVLQSALSTEYEQCVRAAMMTLRCSNNLSQLSACVGILILLAGIRSFSVLCCAEENLWCLLLCHLLHTFHCRDEQELLVNLFLCLVVHIVPECDQILQTFPCHAKSVDKSPSSTGNFTWEVLLCVAEACILQLIHCQSGGAYSTQSFSAVRFCDDKIKAMLVLRAILQYYNGIYANQLSLEGSQINSAILFEPIRRISKIVCDNLDDVLCCLLSTAEAESESFKSSFYAVQYPGLYSISLGLVIVQLLLTLAHLAKNIDVSKYIGKYKIVEHDLCGNFMSHSDLFSRVVDLLTGSILNEKSVIYLEDFIAGSKVNNFYRACDSIFLEFMNAHLNHLNLDRLNVNYLVHTLARPCVNIQSACICILNILFSDTDSAMQAFHNSNFSPSLFSLFFLLMIQERLCVALPISEILSCLIKMTSKYDTEICRLSGDYFVALLLREEDKACCCGIKSEDALDMIDFLPPSQKINFCCCCSAETARTLVGGQVILLILQVIRKHHAYSITTNSASDKNELREKTEGLRLVVCDALKVLKIHSVGWNDAYPPEFLSFIDAIMKSFSFLCVLFSYFGPDFYHDALLRTREDYDCFATLLAVVGSSILTNSSACILFSSTVSLISSVIRLSLCEIKRSAQLQDDFLANFIFLDVGSSRSLHKSLFKCWIQCHKDSTQMLRNDTILHYSEILYFTLHESKKHVHANVTENREATIFTELMCELSSKLSSSKGVDSELILLWARNDKPTTNKFKRICFAKLYLYLLCCLDPMIALKSLDGSYLAEIIQDDSETDLSYALDLVSLHNLVPFIANNVALHSTGRDSLADNIFNVMKHYKRNILHFPAIILSVIFLKSANLDSLFYQSNIQELPCDADEHIELFAFDPVDASTFLRVLLAKSIDVIQLQTKLIKTELNKEINEDVSLTFMLNHVRVMSMVLSLVNPAVTALMRFRKIEHPGDVLNNLCAASFTIVEIMRMSKYSDCDTGYHSRSHINILDKLFAGILLVFMDYERLFIDVNYPMHAFLERSDNYIKFYALIWRLLQRSSMISPLDLDFARNWQILFQLLLQSLMTKVLVSPASQNIDIADDYVNCQVYLSLLEDHITWFCKAGIYVESKGNGESSAACVCGLIVKLHRRFPRNPICKRLLSCPCFPFLCRIQQDLQNVLFAMCAIESAPPHCTILNCCAGLFYGAFLYNAASVESFDCGEMHFHFDLSFTQTFFISCQELVVANTQVESMLLNDTISVFSERITSCSSAWANEFLVKYSYLKAKDKLVLLIKFAALQACISILKYTTREHIYIDLEGWNDDVLEHLSSSTIWRDQSESQHFEVALFNYRLAFADEMASNIYVENGCEKNYFCCHQRDEGATLKESAHLDQYNTSSNWLADHYCDLIVDRDMKEIPKRPIRFINLDDNEDASVYLSLQVYSDLFC